MFSATVKYKRDIPRIEKQTITALATALLCSVTFLFFGPIEIVLSGGNEFWFQAKDVLPMAFLYTAIAFAFIFILICVLSKSDAVIGLFFGLGMALYIQGNYTFIDYGVMDGHLIDWLSFGVWPIVNTLIWIVIIASFVFLSIWKTALFRKIALYGSLGIVMVQFITLGTLSIETLPRCNKKTNAYLSDEGLNTVSMEENVIVLILDNFDDLYFQEILNNDLEFLSPLDGFTYFSNNTGMFPTTKGALPYILTGQAYQNEKPYNDYIKEAYDNTEYYNDLKRAGYIIGLYTDKLFVDDEFGKSKIVNYKENGIGVSSHSGLAKTMYKITGFRYLPHVLKRFTWYYSGELDQWKMADSSNLSVYSDNNTQYYARLKEGLSILEEGRSFQLVHLNGVHPPYTLSENLEEVENGYTSAMSEARGCLKIVYEYIKQLKELEVYDQTTIIVMADHGNFEKALTCPLFLVKPQCTEGPLQVSNAPVSQTDLMATIMTDIGLNQNEKYGRSAFDYKEKEERERIFFHYNWDDTWDLDYLPQMTEYGIHEQGNSPDSFFVKAYSAKAYQLGQVIHFSEDTALSYFIMGISSIETDSVWSVGDYSIMTIKIDEQLTDDLMGTVQFKDIFAPPQRLIIECGETELFHGEISWSNKSVNFQIPKELIQNGILELKFTYPDAKSPADISKNGDTRILALSFYSFVFNSAMDA